jgi:hypothetical protein
MVNGPTIGDAIAHPEGIIAKTVAAGASKEQLIEAVYLSTLCRKPSADEMTRSLEYFATATDPKAASEDLMWALINSPGFLFNR